MRVFLLLIAVATFAQLASMASAPAASAIGQRAAVLASIGR